MPQAALLCPPASAEARRRHAEAVEAAEAADARDGKELKAAAKAAKAAKAAGNRSREKVHYTLGATPSTKTTPSFCSRAPTSKRSPRDSDVVGAAVAWLRARAGSRPFYANVWLHAPHAPVSLVEAVGRPLCEMLGGTAASVLGATPFGHLLAPRAVDWSAFGRPMGVKLAAARRAAAEGGHPIREGGLEQALAEYLATVWVVDFQIGNLLSVLDDELGLGAQTFVVVSADHGPERPWPFGVTDAELNNMGLAAAGASGDKHTILEGGLLVPFLLRWRGAPAGASAACATSHLDLLPTIAELAGVGVSSPTDGRPQRLWLDGGAAAASCTARSREGPPLVHHSKGNLVVHAAAYKLWVYAPSRKGLPTSGGENADTALWHEASARMHTHAQTHTHRVVVAHEARTYATHTAHRAHGAVHLKMPRGSCPLWGCPPGPRPTTLCGRRHLPCLRRSPRRPRRRSRGGRVGPRAGPRAVASSSDSR